AGTPANPRRCPAQPTVPTSAHPPTWGRASSRSAPHQGSRRPSPRTASALSLPFLGAGPSHIPRIELVGHPQRHHRVAAIYCPVRVAHDFGVVVGGVI